MTASLPTGASAPVGDLACGHVTLAVIDVPNIDMALTHLLGRQPGRAERPDWRAVRAWLGRRAEGSKLEVAAFLNIRQGPGATAQARWVEFLRRELGFAVYAKPRRADSDIDGDMLDHIALREREGVLARLVVFSDDAANFVCPLQALRERQPGLEVIVSGFWELAGRLPEQDGLEFVDLEDIPQAIGVALGRTRLDTVPPEGMWFPPIAEGVETSVREAA